MPRPDSLTARLLLGAAVWLGLAVIASGLVLADAFRASVEHGLQQRLEAVQRSLIAGIEVTGDGAVTVASSRAEPRFETPYSGWYWQVSGDDRLLARSRSLWDFAFAAVAGEAGGAVHLRHESGPRGEPVLMIERDLIFPGRSGPLHVLVAASLAETAEEIEAFHRLLALALGGLALGLLGAVVLQVRFGLRPLGRLAVDLERLRSGAAARLGGDYPREIRPLVDATNRVLDHDAALIERARTHVGNLAHGLKTPLAILKAESAARGGDAVIDLQVAAMARLVDRHLGRARAVATGVGGLGDRTPVAPIARELILAMSRIFADRRLILDLDMDPAVSIAMDREDVAEILGNLLENACRHAAGHVRVSARQDAAATVIRVDDDGPGLDETQMAAVAARGVRFDESGSGLGLAIVGDLVALHDGSLTFARSELGGLSVCVRKG